MDFYVIRGSREILISAPHAKPQVRPGFSYKSPKPAETNTDIIVKTLCRKTSCWGIYAIDLQKIDPNWDTKSPYKEKIKELVRKQGVNFVLDIHGASETRNYLVEFDDYKVSTKVNDRIGDYLKACLKQSGFKKSEISHGLLRDNSQETITEFCRKQLRVKALQLEINRKIRSLDNPLFNSLILALKYFILKIN